MEIFELLQEINYYSLFIKSIYGGWYSSIFNIHSDYKPMSTSKFPLTRNHSRKTIEKKYWFSSGKSLN